MPSKISWTDEVCNPVTGCTKCSPGCDNCYAESMAKRLKAMGLPQYQDVVDEKGWTSHMTFAEKQLKKIVKWKKPRKIFIGSMTDIFHESVPFEWIEKIMSVINSHSQHIFQILTKRPENMKKYFSNYYLPENLWLGVTICNQEEADRNIPLLLRTPAAVRFVSIEPMLGDISLTKLFVERGSGSCLLNSKFYTFIENLDWVICGGESGRKARPLNPEWVISLRNQCQSANVPFFFKQWGEYQYKEIYKRKVGTKKAGNKLQGETYEQFPEVK